MAIEGRPAVTDVIDLMPEVLAVPQPWAIDDARMFRLDGRLHVEIVRGDWHSVLLAPIPPSRDDLMFRGLWLRGIMDRAQSHYRRMALARFDRYNNFFGG